MKKQNLKQVISSFDIHQDPTNGEWFAAFYGYTPDGLRTTRYLPAQEWKEARRDCARRIHALDTQCHDRYMDGLRQAHKVAMNCLPLPGCGKKKRLIALGNIMGVVIQAIEREIRKELGLPEVRFGSLKSSRVKKL